MVSCTYRFGCPAGGTLVDGYASLGKPLREERLLQALKDLLAGHHLPDSHTQAPAPSSLSR